MHFKRKIHIRLIENVPVFFNVKKYFGLLRFSNFLPFFKLSEIFNLLVKIIDDIECLNIEDQPTVFFSYVNSPVFYTRLQFK